MYVRYDPSYEKVILQLARAVHEESRFELFEFSEKKILSLLANPNVFCLLNIIDGKGVGFFLGIIQQMWFSEKKYGFDLTLYMLPEHRGGTAAARMVKQFEKFCKEQGCIEISLSSSAEISTEKAKRLYTGLGYQECGFIVRKEI